MAPIKKPQHNREKHFLREWRDYRELSQEDAADRAMVSRPTLSKIESGKVPYNQDMVERLAQAYGCTVADLLGRDPNAQPRIPIFDLPEGDAERVQAFIRALQVSRVDEAGNPTPEVAPPAAKSKPKSRKSVQKID
ncbi:helix-turn-helix domain-containing protein [Beijerinckia sp. L45]|uniref:helix-turn-helix domain-containing protein n=1 Tax=Beijerinckia sp. L45 TaxID=1641855 RepID=UPI001AEEFCB1|nr:helix-turn-helix transcriptional regulator [Beijerinckia sp. L45]